MIMVRRRCRGACVGACAVGGASVEPWWSSTTEQPAKALGLRRRWRGVGAAWFVRPPRNAAVLTYLCITYSYLVCAVVSKLAHNLVTSRW